MISEISFYSELISKGGSRSVDCEREGRKEKKSGGDDEVVLDPGNVNTEALHQGLASAATHPPYFFSSVLGKLEWS